MDSGHPELRYKITPSEQYFLAATKTNQSTHLKLLALGFIGELEMFVGGGGDDIALAVAPAPNRLPKLLLPTEDKGLLWGCCCWCWVFADGMLLVTMANDVGYDASSSVAADL